METHPGNEEAYEEMLEALLSAQHKFKLELDNQWKKLQIATQPLEQMLESLRQHERQSRVTVANQPVAGCSDCTGLSEGMAREGNAAKDLQRRPSVKMISEGMLQSYTDEQDIAFQQVEDEEEAEEQQMMNSGQPRWRRWLLSPWFDMYVAVVIVLNLLVIMFQVEYDGLQHEPDNYRTGSSAIDNSIDVFENIFAVFFVFELMLRLLASGFRYLCSFSNALDALIVVGSSLDLWLLPVVMAGSEPVNLSLLRVFRLGKLMKVLRIVRVVKAFSPLRVLVSAVLSSFGALAWSMSLLFVLQVTAAVLLAQALQMAIQDESIDLQVRKSLWKSFGTMVRAWLSTFEMTFAPGAFMKHAYLFEEVGSGFYLLIVVYVCLVTFATIRVITALFLRNTLSAADKDTGEEEARLKSLRLGYSKRLCMRLEESEGEESGRGRINEHGLDVLLEYKRMKGWLTDAGLSMTDTQRLFRALDLGDGTVYLSQYLAAISQICDRSKDKDIILHHESAKVVQILNNLSTMVDRRNAAPLTQSV